MAARITSIGTNGCTWAGGPKIFLFRMLVSHPFFDLDNRDLIALGIEGDRIFYPNHRLGINASQYNHRLVADNLEPINLTIKVGSRDHI
jgi:hypothetical protein